MFMKITSTTHEIAACILLAGTTSPVLAQFDPASGQWGKLDPAHVRVMTWNVEDGLCSTNFKTDSVGNWNALARVVATLQPDILLLQETADNSGNGTGTTLDSIANLETTLGLFLRGGADPFRGGVATSYVQKFSSDPSFDLPHVFVSSRSDFGVNNGFNRNVILSRWPLADLNGDGVSAYDDIPLVVAPYVTGTGGIRGFQFAEIDLPDDRYGGDLVIGNSHLKSGGGVSNENQRVQAGKAVGYFIDQFYNGGGAGTVDPNDTVFDTPPATAVLDDLTPVIVGGDWNQDEASMLQNPSNIKGPAAWIAEGQLDGGMDGTDRDRTDMRLDTAPRKIVTFNGTVFDGSPLTNSAGKLDYIAHQDSIVTVANEFIFDTFEIQNGAYPPAVAGYPGQPFSISRDAADHWPVIVDFVFPAPVKTDCPADVTGDGAVGPDDLGSLLASWGQTNGPADLDGDGSVGSGDLAILIAQWGSCDSQ